MPVCADIIFNMKNTVNDTRTEQTSKSGQTNAGQTIIDDDAVYKNNIHIHITWYYDPPHCLSAPCKNSGVFISLMSHIALAVGL